MTEIEKKEKVRRIIKIMPPLLIVLVIVTVIDFILILDSLIDGNLNSSIVLSLAMIFLLILIGYSNYKRQLQLLQT